MDFVLQLSAPEVAPGSTVITMLGDPAQKPLSYTLSTKLREKRKKREKRRERIRERARENLSFLRLLSC